MIPVSSMRKLKSELANPLVIEWRGRSVSLGVLRF